MSTLTPATALPAAPVTLGGAAVLAGARDLIRDAVSHRGRRSRIGSRPFVFGVNLAVTPGAVVYREGMFELLHCTPTTKKVRERPLLMVAPHPHGGYLLDLAPSCSLVEFAVSRGVETFMVVWRNRRQDAKRRWWELSDCLGAQRRAIDVVREITDADTINLLGLRTSGITCALVQAQLVASSDNPVHTCTYLLAAPDSRVPELATMLPRVTSESCVVARRTDRITPWQRCYRSSQLLGGPSEVVVVDRGGRHPFVDPVGTSCPGYWAGPADMPDPEVWLAGRDKHTGSWWPHWADWLVPRSGEECPAPTALGGVRYPALDPAPGRNMH